MPLGERVLAFVREFPIDNNGTQAAIRAGYSPNGASVEASRLLANPNVYALIQERKEELAARAGLSVEWVLRQWKMIAEADPNELIYLEVQCCRYCFGINHEYQWNEFEYKAACKEAASHVCGRSCEPNCTKVFPPIPTGGMGFDPHRAPAGDCPVCHGNGREVVRLCDTRRVTGAARKLYAGIKQTQHGIEVKMRDQDEAVMNVAKYLGMVINKNEVSGPGGGPLKIDASLDPEDFTDEQLLTWLQQARANKTIEGERVVS